MRANTNSWAAYIKQMRLVFLPLAPFTRMKCTVSGRHLSDCEQKKKKKKQRTMMKKFFFEMI